MPFMTEPCCEAIIRAEPKNVPTQGEYPTANTMPKSIALKNPSGIILLSALSVRLRNGIFRNPAKLRPKSTTIPPEIILTRVSWLDKNAPNVDARAPRAMNIIEKPTTKPQELIKVCFLPLPAEKYMIYKGSIGSIQGEMKVTMPSRNEIRYCILVYLAY